MPADLTPIEELDQNILTLCTRINAATYELLVMIRQFDERAGWLQWGLDNCAEWLAWRCDLAMTTARDKVRVAHALKQLPLISQAFASGELSYSKVKAMTRVANRENEETLLTFALRHTAITVAERCRELRCGKETSIGTAERAWANRSLRIRREVERNIMTITVELPLDTGELLEKALEKARDDEVLEIPTSVERAVRARDNHGCVFPGCNNRRFLACHHVEHWAHGGETGVDNLVLLCTKHHTLVHEGGFAIRKDFRDNWAFFRPDGIAVPEVGYVSRLDEDAPAGALSSVAESFVKEPPPPQYLH
jgi:hypothetical protein